MASRQYDIRGTLPAHERTIVLMRYDLTKDGKALTLDGIGQTLGYQKNASANSSRGSAANVEVTRGPIQHELSGLRSLEMTGSMLFEFDSEQRNMPGFFV